MSSLKHGEIELWAIDDVKPYEKNAKKHSPEQVKLIQSWILKAGWTQPIIVQRSTGSIIAGHGRRLAALALELKKVPVIALDIDDKGAMEMRLADNRIVSTDYDIHAIQDELGALRGLGVDLGMLGFTEKEFSFLDETIVVFNEEAFIEDITTAVEDQQVQNNQKQADTDEKDSPLSKAFGFKRLTIAQGRRVRAFMSFLEIETGKTGSDALLAYIETLKV